MVPLRLEATDRPRLKTIWDVTFRQPRIDSGHVEAWLAIAAAFSSVPPFLR
jgi:hypothetical protein